MNSIAHRLKDRLWPTVKRFRMQLDAMIYGNCAVLLYHRVIHLDTDPQLLAVSPENFDAQLTQLKQRFRVLTVDEFDHHLLQGKRFPRNSALITFDDGYADNHIHARPLLEKHGLQGLFYISSGYIGSGREYWWDELERILLLNNMPPSTVAYEKALVDLRRLPTAEREAVLEGMRAELQPAPPRATHLPMSRAELMDFARSPSVVIGAHTIGHPSLAYLNEADQRTEIEGSKKELEVLLGRPVRHFAYPFGTPSDLSATTMRIAEAAGFAHAAANHPGIAHARSPRFGFHRVLVRNWSADDFAGHLSRFLN